ncbi:PD-(D/E)XK nuclease family protein [Chryseobacterium sp. JM1]|uniref:PDDEXK-like family protein n=1 Tax=Chryseobacterium sp. JM1 TaxID=1233950 RepID=UPI0004E6ABCC|nr:PD-(D/E)XK nuclease family protein [Chryseobacterium sp. JM1]KFF22842.1 hypothetical protein IW22_00940 [Chryseobacterium sp. JM1]
MTEYLLKEVRNIINLYEKEIIKEGEGFNLISILGMENNERYTHSAIIGELLNPYGSHNFGNLFLKEFLNCVSCDFCIDQIEVITEEYVGLQLGSRTFLDIVIKDKKNGNVILIENKIWAEDQVNQLERYQSSYRNSDQTIFYLTPFESNYYNTSFSNYTKISYHTHIKGWITKCIEIAKEKNNSFIENSLKVYLNIVHKITNQSIYNKMTNDIFLTILDSPENFEAAEKISQEFSKINTFIRNEFFNKLYVKVKSESFECLFGKINIIIDEDNYDPLYLGIQLFNSENKIILDNEKFNLILNQIIEEFPENYPQPSNKWWNTWFQVSAKSMLHKHFIHNLDSKSKATFYKDIENQVEIVSQEFSKILNRLQELLDV